jgi:hypothetical protein
MLQLLTIHLFDHNAHDCGHQWSVVGEVLLAQADSLGEYIHTLHCQLLFRG